jgi:uncharacterized RDD family membrane protein YckC
MFLVTDQLLELAYTIRLLVIVPWMFMIICYPLICEVVLSGKTIGKRVMGLRVICLDGTRPTLESFFLRWLNGLFEIFGSVGMIAFLFVVATKNYQRIGDLAAGTVVISEPKSLSLRDVLLSVGSSTQVQYSAARFLSDEEAETIRQLLNASTSRIDEMRLRKLLWDAAKALKKRMGVESTEDPVTFLSGVLESHQAAHRDQGAGV